MKARDIMTKDPKTCEPQHDLACSIRIMKEEDCGVVPVTEGNGQARVVGVVTDRDIALYLGEHDKRPSEVQVAEVMSTHLITCSPDDDVRDVTQRMQKAQVRRILIVEGGQLRGVISTADLARASAGETRMEKEMARVMEEVSEKGSGRPQA
jgi:CBS domain-containing protein